MAVDYPYCDAAAVVAIAGELGVDLRADDVPDLDAHMDAAIAYATGRVDFYCSDRYAQAELAANQWVNDLAALLAVRWLCIHRLNEPSEGVNKEWEERKEELQLVQTGKARVPRAAHSRRAVTVTNSVVDLRRFNNTVRVDKNRSTGVAKNYRRPADDTSPDER